MKKVLALAGVVAVGLVAPATVGAATKSYAGVFETSGTMGFDVKTKKGKRKVLKFYFSALPVQCNAGPNTATGDVPEYKIKVNDSGRFDADLVSETPGAEAKLLIDGKLKGGGTAEGTVRLKGKDVIVNDTTNGQTQNCDSGKTGWIASTVN